MKRNEFDIYDIASEAYEIKRDDGVKVRHSLISGIKIEQLDIFKEDNIYNKKIGRYTLIDNNKKLSIDSFAQALKKTLQSFLAKWKLKNKSVLLIGIGNKNYAPDSLGPEVISRINIDFNRKKRRIFALSPGVYAQTGLDTAILAKAIIQQEKIDYVIAIDSLVTHKLMRLNQVIQVSDAGISPGSGIGNERKELSKEYLKVPVISIGVATVVSLTSIIKDYIDSKPIDRESYGMLNSGLNKSEDKRVYFTSNDIDYTVEILADIISSVINEILN